MTERTSGEPRANLEAEEAVVGAALISRRSYLFAVEAGITTAAFYNAAVHGTCWAAIVDLEEAGVRANVQAVAAHLRAVGLLEKVGGEQAVLRVSIYGPTGVERSAVSFPAGLVVAAFVQRQLVELGTAIVDSGYEPPECPTRALDHALGLVDQAAWLVAAVKVPGPA